MIHISAAAEAELKRRLDLQPKSQAFVRVGVESGGCAAWYYTLQSGTQLSSDDTKIHCSSFQVVVAKDYLPWLNGLSIDYSEDLMGGSFRFANPNAARTCGCGSSFTLDPEDAISTDCTHPVSISGRKGEVDATRNKMVM